LVSEQLNRLAQKVIDKLAGTRSGRVGGGCTLVGKSVNNSDKI
jgi:hypothetical protein